MTLGKRIRQLREAKGLTQAQLGDLLNKGESTVRTWELDRAQPSPKTIQLLCDVLDTSPNVLLDKDISENVQVNFVVDNILGERVRAARGKLSLHDFSKKCGISQTHLDSIEKGKDPQTGKPVSINADTLVKLSLGTGLSIDYLMGKEDPAFTGTQFEGMSKAQMDLLLFGSFLEVLDEKHPNLTEEEKKAYIVEYHKHDAMDLLLSYFDLNDDNKQYISKTIELLKTDQRKGGK